MSNVVALNARRRSDPPGPARHPYRMKDLCELTGLQRQAIHFYIQNGLLPAGHKTGRNMAYYGDEHVERLRLIKRMQHERFLPLKAIKAILDDQQSAFDESQRGFLLGVKQHLGKDIAESAEAVRPTVLVDELLARLALPRADFDRLVEVQLLGASKDAEGRDVIAADDAWILESWSEVVRLGFARELGFSVDDILIYDEMVQALFQREAQMLAARIPELSPERAAEMIERVLPVVHSFITGMHRAKIRNFMASLG